MIIHIIMQNFREVINKIQPMGKKGYMEAVIRSVKDGDTLTFSLSDVNASSWRSKAGLLNAKDGYLHYSVAVNTALNVLGILNNGDKFKEVTIHN